MIRRLLPTAVLALWAVGLAPVHAWAPRTRLSMADESVRLMPASLRLALENERDAVLRGALEPLTQEDGDEHRPATQGGTLEATILARAHALTVAVEQGAAFHEIARRFGELSHYVADAAFPPGAAGREGAARYAHFAGFCDSRRERFPLVFLGHDDPDLSRGDYLAFARRVEEGAGAGDRDLARAYAGAGESPAPLAFDDRSVPFAVASLAYSQAVTYTVRVWLRAWQDAHGDLSRTPYLSTEQRRRREQAR